MSSRKGVSGSRSGTNKPVGKRSSKSDGKEKSVRIKVEKAKRKIADLDLDPDVRDRLFDTLKEMKREYPKIGKRKREPDEIDRAIMRTTEEQLYVAGNRWPGDFADASIEMIGRAHEWDANQYILALREILDRYADDPSIRVDPAGRNVRAKQYAEASKEISVLLDRHVPDRSKMTDAERDMRFGKLMERLRTLRGLEWDEENQRFT